MKITVYDTSGKNVVKTVEAQPLDLTFGTIRSLIGLLNIDNIEETGELFKMITDAWDQVTDILDQVFPGMEYEDWENVKLKELVPTIIEILKFSFNEILKIPKDPKN